MAQAGTATVKFVGDYSQMNAGLASALAPAKLKSSGMKAGLAIGGALTAAFVGSKVVEEIGKAVSVTKEFDKELSSLKAVADASGKQMDALRKQAIKMGAATVFSATDAAKAQTELAKGGLNASQILGGALKSSLDLAAAGELELAEAAETVVNSMQLFGLEGRATTRIADMLATAANRTTADVSDFAMALKQGGSVAKTAGYSLNDTVVILEALAEAGIKNSDAGTSMKASLIQLLNPTAKQAKLAGQLGISWLKQNGELKNAIQISKTLRSATEDMTKAERTKTFAVLAGTDGFRTLSALYEAGAGKLRGYSQANREQGTAAETARVKTDNLAGDVEELSGAYETLQITVGTLVTPVLRELVQVGTDVVRWTNNALNGLDSEALGLGKSWSQLAGDVFEVTKAFAQTPFDPDGGIKRFINVLSGGEGEEVSRLRKTIAARIDAAKSLQRVSRIAARARSRVTAATRDERRAEAALDRARRRFGAGSSEALRAEIRLQRAKRRTIRLTREARLAERLQGVERRVAASRSRDQVVQEKARIGVLNRSIRTLGRKWEAERRNNGNSKRARELEEKIIAKIEQRDKSQKRLNNVLGDAARQIGPKFAKSLANISTRSATMEKALGRLPRPTNQIRDALGRLPAPIKRVGDTAQREFPATERRMEQLRNASGGLRRVYNRNMGRMPGATSGAMSRIQDSLNNALEAIQNTGIPQAKRKGGLIERVAQRFRNGGVPVALSPGELLKTPDGKMSIVPGKPTAADNFFTTAPVGTKVFTFDGQRRLLEGASEQEALRSQMPHFADGGIVKPTIVGGTKKSARVANAAVGKTHAAAKARYKKLKQSIVSGGNIVELGRSLQRLGYEVAEHPAFGGVAGGHSKNSYHYQGRAIDVNDDVNPRGGSEMASLDWLNAQLQKVPGIVELLWRVPDHYDHLHVAMQKGGLVPNGFRKRMRRVWGAAAPFFGKSATSPVPRTWAGGTGHSRVANFEDGSRAAYLTKRDAARFERGGDRGEHAMIHEWAHMNQAYKQKVGSTRISWPKWMVEGGAEAFTQWAAPRIFGKLGVRYSDPFGGRNYSGFVRRVERELGDRWIRSGQFRQQLQDGGEVAGLSGGRGSLRRWYKRARSRNKAPWLRKIRKFNPDWAYTLARYAGIPNPKWASQVVYGESSYNPRTVGHDPGGTKGYGLWQITTGYNDHIINRYGGREGMFDPLSNARAARDVYKERLKMGVSGESGWYGNLGPAGSFDRRFWYDIMFPPKQQRKARVDAGRQHHYLERLKDWAGSGKANEGIWKRINLARRLNIRARREARIGNVVGSYALGKKARHHANEARSALKKVRGGGGKGDQPGKGNGKGRGPGDGPAMGVSRPTVDPGPSKKAKERAKQIRKLLTMAAKAKSVVRKRGLWWQAIQSYAKGGDFGKGEFQGTYQTVESAFRKLDPERTGAALYNLLRWLGKNVPIHGRKDNRRLSGLLSKARRQGEKGRKYDVKRLQPYAFKVSGAKGIAKLMKKLGANRREMARLDEFIQVAQDRAVAPWSDPYPRGDGAEETPAEIAEQIRLNEKLLERVRWHVGKLTGGKSGRGFIKGAEMALVAAENRITTEGFRAPWLVDGLKKGRDSIKKAIELMKKDLRDMIGLTGTAGKRNLVISRLKELGVSKSGSAVGGSTMSIQDLLSIVEATKYNVFDRMPTFHKGGTVPGAGHEEVMALVKARESVYTPEQNAQIAGALVSPAAGPGDVKVIVHGDIVSDRNDPVEVVVGSRRFKAEVRREIAGANRKRELRALAR